MPWNDFVVQCLLDFCGCKLQLFLAATDTSMFCLFPNKRCNKSDCCVCSFFHLLLGLNRPPGSCDLCQIQFIATPHKYSISNGMTSLHNVCWICDKYNSLKSPLYEQMTAYRDFLLRNKSMNVQHHNNTFVDLISYKL